MSTPDRNMPNMSPPTYEEVANTIRISMTDLVSIATSMQTECVSRRLPPELFITVTDLRKIEHSLASSSKRMDEIAVQQQNFFNSWVKLSQEHSKLGQENLSLRSDIAILKQQLALEIEKSARLSDVEYPKEQGSERDKQDKPENPEKPQQPKPKDNKDDSLEEFQARIAITSGKNAFLKNRQYKEAEGRFQEALKLIEVLPPEKASKFDSIEISYYLAMCAALDTELDLTAKEQTLGAFLSQNGELDATKIAQIYHLRSQLCIQLGELDNARTWCNEAFRNVTHLAEDNQFRLEPIALLIRIRTLLGLETQSFLQQFPGRWQEWFWNRYSHLRQQGKPNPTPNPPLRNEPPQGIKKAPTWSLPQQQEKEKPNKSAEEKADELPTRIFDPATRRQLLTKLGINTQDAEFWEAMIASDAKTTRRLLKASLRPAKALHMAALFGEVAIVKSLLKAGYDFNEACVIKKLKVARGERDEYSRCVTPMHVAIGAQQHGMIRLLASNNASLLVPTCPKSDSYPTAPPRFLLSAGWLRMLGCSDSKDVLDTIDVLLSLEGRPWKINAVVGTYKKAKTLLDYAIDLPKDATGFKQGVIEGLESKGARKCKDL